jgi:hypothetical protein
MCEREILLHFTNWDDLTGADFMTRNTEQRAQISKTAKQVLVNYVYGNIKIVQSLCGFMTIALLIASSPEV